uniref:Uncharacterized protein n=1 Tax=Romanomermis culicivorax TaxID=13658 RepID=A0A915JM89_ROMCU
MMHRTIFSPPSPSNSNRNSTADNPSCSSHHLNSSDDDKQSLLRNDHLAKCVNENIPSSSDNQVQISQQQHSDDSVSVIDCSTAVPVIVSSGENVVAGASCLSEHLQFDGTPRHLTPEMANGPRPPLFMLPPFLPMPHPTDYFPFRHQMAHFRPFGRPLGDGGGRSRLRQLPAHMQRGWPAMHFSNPPGSPSTDDGLLFPLRNLPPRVNVIRQSSGRHHQETEDHHATPPIRPTCYI